MNERRQFSRVLFSNPAQLRCQEAVWQTTLLDISLNGALVETPAQFAPDTEQLQLSFTIPDSDIQVQMETELVHQKDNQLGLACQHIDVESISHLRRLVELNVGDPTLLNRELTLFIDMHSPEK
ncbi:PilZ domain-containing protein [Shewanella kaireitica]|uniref:PilZ domain-containing protein n=1 Tax=Shewanella kaireitica TaxID=212021 RepID=UPI00200F4DB5|nr:PilZ domain-containing protein [Shewanella kaireitica]MCL1096093.1 PilZ domain-containing protein [Shewanella kaireitica]